MHIIRECVLEYRGTYMVERLFRNSFIKSHIKSIKAMEKILCNLDYTNKIKAHPQENMPYDRTSVNKSD